MPLLKSILPEPFNWILLLTLALFEVDMLLPADNLIVPLPLTSLPSGSSINPPLPVLVISAFKIISFEASKVKSFELLDDIVLWIVISPFWKLEPPVWTVTLLEDSAVSNVETLMKALSPSDAKFGLDPEFKSLPDPIVMLKGSISPVSYTHLRAHET